MAAPVIASKSVNVSSINALTNVVGAPAGIVDGDLLLYFLVLDGIATSIIVPTGFTEITPSDGDKAPSSAAHLVLAWKIASSESGSYTSTWTTGQHSIANMYRITGQAAAGFEIHAPATVETGTVSPVTSTPFNTDTDDVLAMAFSAVDRDFGNSSEFGSGWTTEDYDETSGSGPEVAAGSSIKTVVTKGTNTLASNRTLTSGEEWTTRQIGIRSAAIRTLTHTTDSFIVKHFQTHTTDSVLKALDTELTHTTDSRVVTGVTLTHTTDSVLGERDPGFSVTHTTDSILKAIQTLSHTTDSQLNTVITITHTTDSLIVTSVAVTHTTDSVLKELDNILTHTTDSIVYLTKTLTHNTDSVLKATNTLITHTTDSVLKALDQIKTHTTDSALKEIDNLLTHTTDSLLLAIKTLSHTTDSHLVFTIKKTLTHTTDSILKKLDNVVSHTTDSLLTNIRGKRVIVDLCVVDKSTEELCRTDESEVDLCA